MTTASTPQVDGKTSGRELDLRARIRDAFEAQRAHRWVLAATTAEQRIEKLERLKAAMLDGRDELRRALHADFRKPAAEVDLTELQPVLGEIGHTVKHLKKWMTPVRVPTPPHLFGTRSFIRYEPRGSVLLLAPWNYPFHLLMSPLVGAVAAGNTVMLRPSDKVPTTSRFMARLLAGVFPEREVASFVGPSSIASAMLELPFDHVFFTGSERVGKQVMAAAAKHLASVTLELGGQSPVVVDESADIELAAQRLVWAKFLNAGQTCVAPNHVFVHESKARELVEAAKRYVQKHYGETDTERRASPDLCRIVDAPSLGRLVETIERTVSAGAKLEIGGTSDAAERFLAPTILSGVKDDHPVMDAEIFGPVLPVLAYRSLDEVIESIRKRGKPLAMYVFSESSHNVERLLAATSSGGTVINNCVIHLANPDLPFGGVGASGQGSYHGFHGFRTFSHERAVMEQGRPGTVKLFFPPYGPRVRRAVDLLTRWLAR